MSGIPAWARAGAKVVCIVDMPRLERARRNYPGFGLPEPQKIYTIRDWVIGTNDVVNLRLVEIVNRPMYSTVGTVEWGFSIQFFRPLITLEDDISTHFAALLDVKQPSPVGA